MKKLLPGLFLLLFTASQVLGQGAQERTITGTVTAREDGLPLPGVSVIVKGTNVGTQTGADGKYSLRVPAGSNQLEFRFIGYSSQTVAIKSDNTVNVSLIPDATQLGEVVVTALGIQRNKKDLGYSVGTVSSEDLTTGRTTNVVNALAAKVAGVRVSSANGMVGSSSGIFIRGNTTFTGSNQPLFVVDGVPIDNGGGANALQTGVSNSNRAIDINQEDIESVSILKGPAAAALYGSRAASGAIIITTKKGKASEKNRVQISSSYNLAEVNRFPEWQNEYAQGAGGVYNPIGNLSWGPRIAGQTVTNFQGKPEVLTSYPNNIEDIFKQGSNIQNNLSFTGSGDNSSFRLSYGNTAERGILSNNKLGRHNFTFAGQNAITTKLTTGLNVQYINSRSDRTQIGNQLSNPFFRGWFIPRNINLSGLPFEDANGNQVYFDATDNPYWTLKNNTYHDEVNRVIGSVNLKYDLLPWLNANYRLGGDTYNFVAKGYDQIGARGQANTAAQGTGGIYDQGFLSRDINSTFTLSGRKQLNQDFNVSFNLGNEIIQNLSKDVTTVGKQLAIRDLKNISNAAVVTATANTSLRRLVGFYADATLGYKDFVTLNILGRNDFSSTFGDEKNSYFYPAAALSFIPTDAFKGLKSDVIEFVKISANYAKVGKEASAYATNTYFLQAGASDGFGPSITFPYNGLGGRSLSNTAGDPNLGPEFTTSKEVGLQMQFFKNRISFEANLYQTDSEDLIFNVPVAGSSGFTVQNRNAGSLKNKGVEFLLNATPIKTSNGSWDISLNFARNRSEVVSLAEGVPVITLAGFVTPNVRLEAGKPYGILFGSVFNRNADGSLLINAAGLPSLSPITAQIGDTNPDWTGGVTNNINFKGVNLNFLIDVRKGGDIFSRNIGDLYRSGAAKETAEFNRFNADGTLAKPYVFEGKLANGEKNTIPVTAEQYWGTKYAFGTGESYVFDGSWVRLREASLSYSLPADLLRTTPFGKVELGVNGRNLFLRAKNFPHFDPESNQLGVSNAQGFEFNGLPQTRTYGIFLRATL